MKENIATVCGTQTGLNSKENKASSSLMMRQDLFQATASSVMQILRTH